MAEKRLDGVLVGLFSIMLFSLAGAFGLIYTTGHSEQICGEIVATQAYRNLSTGTVGAYFAIADKNGNIHQGDKSGLWPLGMHACVEGVK